MRELAVLHDGAFYHLTCLDDLAAAGVTVRPVYLPDLAAGRDTLDGVERLLVCDRLHPRLWSQVATDCLAVAACGGAVFLAGENTLDDAPGWQLTRTGTNYWWWRTGEDPGIEILDSGDPLQDELTERAQRWHYHGVLGVPQGAQVLVHHRDQGGDWPAGALLAVHREPGVLAVTTMDPTYHHGSRFMPGASDLLWGVIRWLDLAHP